MAFPRIAGLTPADHEAAIRAGIAAEQAAVAEVVGNPHPPTVANTLVPLERGSLEMLAAAGSGA